MAWITVLTSSVNRVIVNNKTIMTKNKQDQYIKSMGMCLEVLNIDVGIRALRNINSITHVSQWSDMNICQILQTQALLKQVKLYIKVFLAIMTSNNKYIAMLKWT